MERHKQVPKYELFAVDTSQMDIYQIEKGLGMTPLKPFPLYLQIEEPAECAEASLNIGMAILEADDLHDIALDIIRNLSHPEGRSFYEDKIDDFRRCAIQLLRRLDRIPGLLESAQPGELYYILNEHREELNTYKWPGELWMNDLLRKAWLVKDDDWLLNMIYNRAPIKALWTQQDSTSQQ